MIDLRRQKFSAAAVFFYKINANLGGDGFELSSEIIALA